MLPAQGKAEDPRNLHAAAFSWVLDETRLAYGRWVRRNTAHRRAGTPAAAAPTAAARTATHKEHLDGRERRSGYRSGCASNFWMRSTRASRSGRHSKILD
jgi:hypothetical protein